MIYPSDLGERTYQFAKQVAFLCRRLPKREENHEYSKQLLRCSASVGANYIEANDALGRRDFAMRIRICRKEAKESAFFLRLIADTNEVSIGSEAKHLVDEAIELKKIFSAILQKTSYPTVT